MRRVLLVLALALALAPTPPARADGDPASDVLVSQDVFTSYTAPAADLTTALRRVTAAARAGGFPVKVALILRPSDLGAYPRDFGDANGYALRLSRELPVNPHGGTTETPRVLVVMPSGFGGIELGERVDEALDPIDIDAGAGADGLAAAGIAAVARLATVNGVPLATPPEASRKLTSSGGGGPSPLLYAAPVVPLFLAVGAVRWRAWRRQRR